MPQLSHNLKRKASTELHGPSKHSTPFPSEPSSASMLENPFAAFAAMGILPNMPSMKQMPSKPSIATSCTQSTAPSTTTATTSAATVAAKTTTTTTTTATTAPATAATGKSAKVASASTATASPLISPSAPGFTTNSSAPTSTIGSMPLPPFTPMLPGFPGDADSVKYANTVSQIASYYQQRCQAIANFQHQKCQAWATVQRQKCQETMQAAMLVVAWYVRDRIRRRRKKQKRRFHSGLKALGTHNQKMTTISGAHEEPDKINKSDAVSRWILNVPEEMTSPNVVGTAEEPAESEDPTSPDTDAPLGRDGKLLRIADNLIRSQYRKLNVPLLGLLSFDESSGESDDEDSTRNMAHADEDEDEEDDDDDDDDDELDEDLEIELMPTKHAATKASVYGAT
ncbi:hypothetical protein Cpir12675_001325 [Ceratocystis pirilliformis]|uniref:Uncharacterized protein n=1 Tax=Ceratocystis pirilliformis TaxID=259994 RepID=A0ABR3ZG10_9PEZI